MNINRVEELYYKVFHHFNGTEVERRDVLDILVEHKKQLEAGEDKADKLAGGLTTAPMADTSPSQLSAEDWKKRAGLSEKDGDAIKALWDWIGVSVVPKEVIASLEHIGRRLSDYPPEISKPSCPCVETEPVYVHIDADLSHTGKERWDWKAIDKCLAPIVWALQKAGINMRGSCCTHGKGRGSIDLSDGRVITIYNKAEEARRAEELLVDEKMGRLANHPAAPENKMIGPHDIIGPGADMLADEKKRRMKESAKETFEVMKPAAPQAEVTEELVAMLKKIMDIKAPSALEVCCYGVGVPKKWLREVAPAIDAKHKAVTEIQAIVRPALARLEALILAIAPGSTAGKPAPVRVSREWVTKLCQEILVCAQAEPALRRDCVDDVPWAERKAVKMLAEKGIVVESEKV